MAKADDNMISQKQRVIDLLEKEVMPILCDKVEAKFDKLDAEIVLSVEHIPGHPLSVILHCKDDSEKGVVAIPLENRSTKKPQNHGVKWNKSHLKKLLPFINRLLLLSNYIYLTDHAGIHLSSRAWRENI